MGIKRFEKIRNEELGLRAMVGSVWQTKVRNKRSMQDRDG